MARIAPSSPLAAGWSSAAAEAAHGSLHISGRRALRGRGPEALRPQGRRVDAAVIVRLRNVEVMDNPPPPPPRMPREKKMTDVEKQADAIVHAVVAVELLHWHGKLAGTLENAFRKCVYVPVLPRLQRLTNREESSDDFKIDKSGRKLSRPSRVHDATLEKQFTLGYVFTEVALKALSRLDKGEWFPLAQYKSRAELLLAGTAAGEDPAAKDLVAFAQGSMILGSGEERTVSSRAVGHGDATPCIWILPVFVDHDRSSHAERQALLLLLEDVPIGKDEGVQPEVKGSMRVYASHTPCISCLSSMCQFTRAFEGAKLAVTFDQWKETRRWIGLEGPEELPDEDEE